MEPKLGYFKFGRLVKTNRAMQLFVTLTEKSKKA